MIKIDDIQTLFNFIAFPAFFLAIIWTAFSMGQATEIVFWVLFGVAAAGSISIELWKLYTDSYRKNSEEETAIEARTYCIVPAWF